MLSLKGEQIYLRAWSLKIWIFCMNWRTILKFGK